MSHLCDPMDCSPPDSSVHGIFPGKNTGVGCHFLLQGIFTTLGIEPGSPALQADSSPTEPPEKGQESFRQNGAAFIQQEAEMKHLGAILIRAE